MGGGGEIEASCQIEIELANDIDPGSEEFQCQARRLYAACWQAVDDQLSWREGSPWSHAARWRRQ
jgi:hypothetical protein